MSHYPIRLPLDLADVLRGHIQGKVTDVTSHNQRWLRDALDIALLELRLNGKHDLIMRKAFTEPRYTLCPCGTNNKPGPHHKISCVVYKPDSKETISHVE